MNSPVEEGAMGKDKVVMAAHCSHCGGTCLLKLHVQNGAIRRIETDDGEEPQYRACARGRALRQMVYHPDRILYPMRRVGSRGEGKFERVSWDDALNEVVKELTRVRSTHGAESILYLNSFGDIGELVGKDLHHRLLCLSGGCSEVWGVHSCEGGIFSAIATYGTDDTINTRDDLLNSRLILLWGCNPADTVLFTNTVWYLIQAKEAGARIVCIDPKFSNTAALLADDWIPIKPGTDVALLVSMAYVMIKENLQDQNFLDSYTVGFHKFKDYVLGGEDGIAKTPSWASGITGVSEFTIETLAKEYATLKPAALLAGFSFH